MARTYTLRRDIAPTPTPNATLDAMLNDEQRAVVHAGAGPKLVIAGAGTGKTSALCARVAHLVQQGVPAEQILLLTFTNRAAREMIDRVGELIQQPMDGMPAGTFHSIGRRWITEFSATLGFPEIIQVIDRDDATVMLQRCYDAVPQELRREKRFPKTSTLLNLLSKSINTGRSFEDVVMEEARPFAPLLPALYDILVAYQEAKRERGLVDFDDLLIYSHRLLNEHPAVAANLANRYQHVLVDEYQDTNLLQAQIVDKISATHGNLTVVGDDHQSIYAWRGAVHDNILHFADRHPQTETFYLTQNYRSSPQILRLANESIKNNTKQFEKSLHSDLPASALPAVINAQNQQDEAQFVAQRVLELLDEGIPLHKIAVLFRAQSHVTHVELELKKRNIPYVMRAGLRFFERAHIKDCMSFLRAVLNPRDDLATHRIMKMCEGIGDKTAMKIATMYSAYGSATEALTAPALLKLIPSRAKTDFQTLRAVLMQIDAPSFRNEPSAALERIIDSFYGDIVARQYDLPKNRLQDLDSLIELGSTYDDFQEFLTAMTLDNTMIGRDIVAMAYEAEPMVLSSVHQAKGLEFHTVFVLSMNAEKFPIGSTIYDIEELEEERRLFYVAVTRAQRALYLCRPLTGSLGRNSYGPLRLSNFIGEIAHIHPPVFESWSLN